MDFSLGHTNSLTFLTDLVPFPPRFSSGKLKENVRYLGFFRKNVSFPYILDGLRAICHVFLTKTYVTLVVVVVLRKPTLPWLWLWLLLLLLLLVVLLLIIILLLLLVAVVSLIIFYGYALLYYLFLLLLFFMTIIIYYYRCCCCCYCYRCGCCCCSRYS